MPFDPDAYLASKAPAAGAFDPDAYLAAKGPIAPATPAEPQDKRGLVRKYVDTVRAPFELGKTMLSSAIAGPVSDVAGLAATGYEALAHGGQGDGDMPSRFRDDVRNRLTYHSDNPTARAVTNGIGAVGDTVGRVAAPAADALRGDGPANAPRGMLANAAIEGVKQAPNFIGLEAARAVPKVTSTVSRGVDTLTGATARTAKGEALTATRGALGDVDKNLGAAQDAKLTDANAYTDEAARIQRTLDAARQRGAPTSDVLGASVRDDYLKVMADAKAAREQAVTPLYDKAKASAAAREAQGQFIDVKPAVKDLDEMLRLSQNLPDLHAKLSKLRQSVEAVAPKADRPPPVSIVDANGRPLGTPITPDASTRTLSYAELDMASRYIKDIAFSGEAEGYGALIRNTAKRLSVQLDAQISKAVPEHAAATAKYRELSEPMETLGTRIGSVLYDTEGGLKGEAYAKVPTQDLPSRVFGKKDRIEQLVDALAGGKNASPAARTVAQAKVDTWVENWILDKTSGKVGVDAAKAVATPDMRATLNAVPGARDRLAGQFEREAQQQARVPELGKAADASRAAAADVAKQRVAVRSQIERADIDLAHGNKVDAYTGYVSALRASLGSADPAKYRAAIGLIERAGSLEAKTAKAQSLARKFVYGAAAVGAGYEARGVLQ